MPSMDNETHLLSLYMIFIILVKYREYNPSYIFHPRFYFSVRILLSFF